MKMLEAVKASPRSQAIRKDPQGRGWWKGYNDGSFGLISEDGGEYTGDLSPDPDFRNANDWIPVMDFTAVGYPAVVWEASKLRCQVGLLRDLTAWMSRAVEELVDRLGMETRDEAIRLAMKKLKEMSEELRQLDTGV